MDSKIFIQFAMSLLTILELKSRIYSLVMENVQETLVIALILSVVTSVVTQLGCVALLIQRV